MKGIFRKGSILWCKESSPIWDTIAGTYYIIKKVDTVWYDVHSLDPFNDFKRRFHAMDLEKVFKSMDTEFTEEDAIQKIKDSGLDIGEGKFTREFLKQFGVPNKYVEHMRELEKDEEMVSTQGFSQLDRKDCLIQITSEELNFIADNVGDIKALGVTDYSDLICLLRKFKK